jgi:hypothetical protein
MDFLRDHQISILLIHGFPQYGTGLEGQNPPSGNHQIPTRLRISSLSRTLLTHNEIAKAGDFDLFSTFQGLFENLEYLIHDSTRFLPWKRAFFTENCNEFRFRYSQGCLRKNRKSRECKGIKQRAERCYFFLFSLFPFCFFPPVSPAFSASIFFTSRFLTFRRATRAAFYPPWGLNFPFSMKVRRQWSPQPEHPAPFAIF